MGGPFPHKTKKGAGEDRKGLAGGLSEPRQARGWGLRGGSGRLRNDFLKPQKNPRISEASSVLYFLSVFVSTQLSIRG